MRKDPITYFIAGARQTGIAHRIENSRYGPWRRGSAAPAKSLRLKAAPNLWRSFDFTGQNPGRRVREMRPLIVGGHRERPLTYGPTWNRGQEIARPQEEHASARQHRLFNVSARTRPRAGVAHTRDFPTYVLLGYGERSSIWPLRRKSAPGTTLPAVSGLSDGDVSRINAIYSRE